MPRVYVRKTRKGQVPENLMREAVQCVKEGAAIREVGRRFGIARTTLRNNILKESNGSNSTLEPNYRHAMIFSNEQERLFSEYLETCSRMFHGLTQTSARKLAYEMAYTNGIKYPSSWDENKTAGKEWMIGFLSRHPNLSLRQPEATSLARALAFNRHNVKVFFDNLEERINALRVNGRQIFNLDETGITTVQRCPKVIAPRGTKQVGQITSRERGELVTLCGIISAAGQ